MFRSMDDPSGEMLTDATGGSAPISKSKRRRDKKKQKQQQQQLQQQCEQDGIRTDQHDPKQVAPNPTKPTSIQQSDQQSSQKQPVRNEQQKEHHQTQDTSNQQHHNQLKKPPQDTPSQQHQKPPQDTSNQQHQNQQKKPPQDTPSQKHQKPPQDTSNQLSQNQQKRPQTHSKQSREEEEEEENRTPGSCDPKGKDGGEGGVKSKAQLRAERRAIQEAQRAAKANKQAGSAGPDKSQPTKGQPTKGQPTKSKPTSSQAPGVPEQKPTKKVVQPGEPRNRKESDSKKENPALRVMDEVRHDDPQIVKRRQKKMEKQKICPRVDIRKKVELFSHLPQYEIGSGLLTSDWEGGTNAVHGVVYRYGLRMAYGKLMGAHNRCCALIDSVLSIIDDYEFSKDKEFAKDFENTLSPNISFLSQCRPMTAGMRGFLKHFKANVVSIGRDDKLEDEERKKELKEVCKVYKERLDLARQTICERAATKINDGDVLLVYAHSSLVRLVLDHAWSKTRRNFRVIVADSEPLWEGRQMLCHLESRGIPCEYVSLSGVPSIMSRVTRVLLGAQALLNNGSVLSRAGTGLVALMAHEFRSVVIVLCESYKFWERVQLDSFVYNELGDPNALVDSDAMRQLWGDPKSGLHYLNPIYDITPSDLVDMVITEKSIMPATSVPVVLRSKNATGV